MSAVEHAHAERYTPPNPGSPSSDPTPASSPAREAVAGAVLMSGGGEWVDVTESMEALKERIKAADAGDGIVGLTHANGDRWEARSHEIAAWGDANTEDTDDDLDMDLDDE